MQAAAPVNNDNYAKEYISFIIDEAVSKSMTANEIKTATAADPLLRQVADCIATENWRQATASDLLHLQPFVKLREELSTNADRNIILRQTRLVLPASLQQRAIDIAHIGHAGMSATKRLMRTKVWFPRLDRMVEETICSCIPWQCNVPEHTRVPLQMTPLPENVWEHLNLDFLGPLPDGSYPFVVVDQNLR